MTIWKYELCLGSTELSVPFDAKFLHAGVQGDNLFIWMLVDPSVETVKRLFTVYGTGDEVYSDETSYLATVQMGPFVWHVFED